MTPHHHILHRFWVVWESWICAIPTRTMPCKSSRLQFQGKQDLWESHPPGKIPHLEDFPVLNVEERSPSGKASSFWQPVISGSLSWVDGKPPLGKDTRFLHIVNAWRLLSLCKPSGKVFRILHLKTVITWSDVLLSAIDSHFEQLVSSRYFRPCGRLPLDVNKASFEQELTSRRWSVAGNSFSENIDVRDGQLRICKYSRWELYFLLPLGMPSSSTKVLKLSQNAILRSLRLSGSWTLALFVNELQHWRQTLKDELVSAHP